jgi:uridine kinase
VTSDSRKPLSRRALLEQLAQLVVAMRLPHPTRVGVDGPDAAGKTTLADELALVLRADERHVIRASIDGFHRPRVERYARGADSARGYYEDSFDHDAIRGAVLDPLGSGGDRRYRVAIFDHRSDARVSRRLAVAPADAVLLFDGVFLQRPELRDGFDLCVFVDVTFDEVLRRALDRDAGLLGGRHEVERRYVGRYIPAQRIYAEEVRPRERADVVVVNDEPAAPVLARVGGRALSPRAGRPAR